MIKAYCMISVKPGQEDAVVTRLKKDGRVKSADVVYGEYDVVTKINAKDMKDLQNFLTGKIRKIKSIEKTSTMISMK
ncbi:MAG: Lrp/AsnC family transcriptional regulator [Nanoarchaeota archaeon]|nr:Lrp/AsnC family transcriptional regulator [Nanoarchaeota archaeon]